MCCKYISYKIYRINISEKNNKKQDEADMNKIEKNVVFFCNSILYSDQNQSLYTS